MGNVCIPKKEMELPGIYSLTYKNNYDLTMSLVRLQEFYEGPAHKGQVFSLEDYMDYWCRTYGNGMFTYTECWGGFNIPGQIVHDFFKQFKELRSREQELFSILLKDHSLDEISKSYFIFVQEKDSDLKHTLQHEIAHGMFCLYTDYRESCIDLIKKIPKKSYDLAENRIKQLGYHKDVVEDEMQAYFSTPNTHKLKKDHLSPRKEFIGNFKKWHDLKKV